LIDEIYSHRHGLKSGIKSQLALDEAVIDFFEKKLCGMKSKVDQQAFDLLASIEHHKDSSADVMYFYSFLV
jgi:hypothetical protein